MKKKVYVILIWLSVVAFAMAQDTPKSFNEFFVEGMEKIDGIFPVYVWGDDVYLEIPRRYIGREIVIGGQIDRGFDLIGRPVKGLGVARIISTDEATVCFRQPFYSERMLDEKSPDMKAFSLSNVQPSGMAYPVVAYSKQQDPILRITDFLLTGNDWFSYDYTIIRSMVSDLSKLIRVHPFDEGVSFTIRRYHEAEASANKYSSSSIVLPPASLPLEVTCVLRLLPEKKDRIRLADNRIPYQTIRFKDYSQHPYALVEDSLILRWDTSRPLVFYVDTLFPKEYFQAVKEGVLAWNEAFRKAGIRNALQVQYVGKQSISAEQKALISFDLREPGVKSALTYHPRTGEILSCRIHVGHGFLDDMLDDYLLCHGATDRRITNDRRSIEVAKDLLKGEITRETGTLLGLMERGKDAIRELPYKIKDADRQAIYFGYHSFSGHGSCYEEREKLRQWITKLPECSSDSDIVSCIATKLTHLQEMLNRLDKIIYKKKSRDNGRALVNLYRKGIRQYGNYLSELIEVVGSNQPTELQHKAMQQLDSVLFHPVMVMDCSYIKENMLATKSEILYPELRRLFRKLLNEDKISALCSQALKDVDEYSDKAFFHDFYQGIFNGFSVSAPVSREQLDYQLLCVNEWILILKKSEQQSNGAKRLKEEIVSLNERLKELSNTHVQPDVRDIYTLLVKRINGYLH